MLSLPESLLDGVRQRTLTREHGIELTRLSSMNMKKLVADKVAKEGMTVKRTRTLIDALVSGKIKNGKKSKATLDSLAAETFRFSIKGKKLEIRGFVPSSSDIDYIQSQFRLSFEAWKAENDRTVVEEKVKEAVGPMAEETGSKEIQAPPPEPPRVEEHIPSGEGGSSATAVPPTLLRWNPRHY